MIDIGDLSIGSQLYLQVPNYGSEEKKWEIKTVTCIYISNEGESFMKFKGNCLFNFSKDHNINSMFLKEISLSLDILKRCGFKESKKSIKENDNNIKKLYHNEFSFVSIEVNKNHVSGYLVTLKFSDNIKNISITGFHQLQVMFKFFLREEIFLKEEY